MERKSVFSRVCYKTPRRLLLGLFIVRVLPVNENIVGIIVLLEVVAGHLPIAYDSETPDIIFLLISVDAIFEASLVKLLSVLDDDLNLAALVGH